jgi:hypothetical protein
MTTTHTTHDQRVSAGAAALWASAAVLLGMIIHAAGARQTGKQARADVAFIDDLTLATLSTGPDEHVVAILDQQSERLFIYGVDQGRSVELYQVESLPAMFRQGRGAATGQRPSR